MAGAPGTKRTSINLHASTASQTAPGAKFQLSFSMVVTSPLPWQFRMHWPISFAIKQQTKVFEIIRPKALFLFKASYDYF